MWHAESKISLLRQVLYRGKRTRENECCVCFESIQHNELCPKNKNEEECEEFCSSKYDTESLEYKACKQRYTLDELSCGHEVCEACKIKMLEHGQSKCPICRAHSIERSILQNDVANTYDIAFDLEENEDIRYEVPKQEIQRILDNRFSRIEPFRFESIKMKKRQFVLKEYVSSLIGFEEALDDLYNEDLGNSSSGGQSLQVSS